MPSHADWEVPAARQPRPENYQYDLETVLRAVVGLHCLVPSDSFTAESLGVERAGNGVLISDDLILTIGYLVIEAQTVWIHLIDDRVVQGHVLGIDHETGFGLVQALQPIAIKPLKLGDSDAVRTGDNVVLAGVGGRASSVASQITHREEFAGYWEYLLEDAIFTSPPHPNWGGTGLISDRGELIGIGSLQIEREQAGVTNLLNMTVPINLLKPVLGDLKNYGRVNRPARPWLGMYATQIDQRIVLVGIAPRGPAARAEIHTGDIVLAVNHHKVNDIPDLYRAVWALGPAGTNVLLSLQRRGETFDVALKSSDRVSFLKGPRLH